MSTHSAPILRRFAAFLYDSFIIFSWLLVLTSFALLLNDGQSLKPYQVLFSIYLMLGCGIFVSWFWQKSGQTLGMLAWKIKVVDQAGDLITWRVAFKRYLISILSVGLCGLGLFWCLIDKDRQSLHDRLSKTRLINIV